MDYEEDSFYEGLLDYAIYSSLCDKYGSNNIPDFETAITMVDTIIEGYKKCKDYPDEC